jgi:hypothetical protein
VQDVSGEGLQTVNPVVVAGDRKCGGAVVAMESGGVGGAGGAGRKTW